MTNLILIPAAQTEWRATGRLAGDMDLPLNETGHRQAVEIGRKLTSLSPGVIRGGSDQPTKQTASLIAHELGLRTRAVKELREVKLGLWQGLTEEDLRERFESVFRQWRNDPLMIEPPEGETLGAAGDRLAAAIERIRRKQEGQTVVVVTGIFAFATICCRVVDKTFERFWESVEEPPEWRLIELPDTPEAL
jgi:broad specificity phosphatase PhoE